jgi:hypothetical protein
VAAGSGRTPSASAKIPSFLVPEKFGKFGKFDPMNRGLGIPNPCAFLSRMSHSTSWSVPATPTSVQLIRAARKTADPRPRCTTRRPGVQHSVAVRSGPVAQW